MVLIPYFKRRSKLVMNFLETELEFYIFLSRKLPWKPLYTGSGSVPVSTVVECQVLFFIFQR